MKANSVDWELMQKTMHEVIGMQEAKLLAFGRKIVPQLTSDDILQPNDFPELENDPHFRYEEGVLEGMRTVEMALRASLRERMTIN